MNYGNPDLRDRLAAEYVLGTMRGAARARFASLLKYDPEWRRRVAEWETRLTPLALAGSDIAPPRSLWPRILARVAQNSARYDSTGAVARSGMFASLAFWRGIAVTSTTAVLALGMFTASRPAPEPPIAMVAVMSTEKAEPAMVVSWPPQKSAREPHIRIKVIQDHATMPDNTSWELWMLPGGKAAPVSLGLVGLDENQVVKLKPEHAGMIGKAWGVALTVEPKGGSPTGAPTGPVIFKGQCVKIL